MNESIRYDATLPGQPSVSLGVDPESPQNPLAGRPGFPAGGGEFMVQVPTRKETLMFSDHHRHTTTLTFYDKEFEKMFKNNIKHEKKCFLLLLLFQLAPLLLVGVINGDPPTFFENCLTDLIIRGGICLGLLVGMLLSVIFTRLTPSLSGHLVLMIAYIILGVVQVYTIAQPFGRDLVDMTAQEIADLDQDDLDLLHCTRLPHGGAAFFATSAWYATILVCCALNQIIWVYRGILVIFLSAFLVVLIPFEEYRYGKSSLGAGKVELSYYATWVAGNILFMLYWLWSARTAEIDARFAFFATEKSAQKVVHPRAEHFRGETGTYEKAFGSLSVALIVGIDNHRSGDSMYTADRLVREMYAFLQTHGFPASNIHVLTGPCATRKNVLEAVSSISTLTEKWDANNGAKRFWFYWCGHGFEKDGRGYILPYDGNLLFPHSTCLSMDLRDIVGTVKAKQKFVIMDCSRSGLAIENHGGSQRGTHQWGIKKLREMTTNEASEILTSGTYGQMTTDDEKHGLLTAAFMSVVDETPITQGHTTAKLVAEAVTQRVYRTTVGMQKPAHRHFIRPPKGETVFFPLANNDMEPKPFTSCVLHTGGGETAAGPEDCPHVNDDTQESPW